MQEDRQLEKSQPRRLRWQIRVKQLKLQEADTEEGARKEV